MKCPLCGKTMKYRFKASENGFCGYWYCPKCYTIKYVWEVR